MFFAFRYCFFLNASEAPFNKGRQAAVRGFGGEGRAFLVAVGVGAEGVIVTLASPLCCKSANVGSNARIEVVESMVDDLFFLL